MGAQQAKLCEKRFHLQKDNQSDKFSENVTPEVAEKNVMYENSRKTGKLPSVSSPDGSITIAAFARIKTEPISGEEYLQDQSKLVIDYNSRGLLEGPNHEYIDICDSLQKPLGPEINTRFTDSEENFLKSLNCISVEVKKELLDSLGSKISLNAQEKSNAAYQESSGTETSEYCSAIKRETIDNAPSTEFFENENIVGGHVENSKQQKKLNLGNGEASNLKIVKNPFAFLKKSHSISLKEQDSIEITNQLNLCSNSIKLEPVIFNDELETSTGSGVKSLAAQNAKEIEIPVNKLNSSPEPLLNNYNELIIKSEYLCSSEENKETYNEHNNANDASSSFDDSDFNKTEHCIGNVKLPLSTDCYSAIQMSSDIGSLLQKSRSTADLKTSKTQKHYKLRGTKNLTTLNQRRERKQIKDLFKTSKAKRKTNSNRKKKHTKKDTNFIMKNLSSKQICKMLPEISIKTRRNLSKQVGKEDFPKPFKLEPPIPKRNHNIALELPKPMILKRESNATPIINNESYYLTPKFQPCVRLKRLNCKDVQERKVQKLNRVANAIKNLNYNQVENNNRKDLQINRAFSLHPNSDDQCFVNNQNQLGCFLTPTRYDRITDMSNESLTGTETKYFTAQELFTHFATSTTADDDDTSMFGSHIDSGVSTSTANCMQHSSPTNRALLLEIAAERAFINNHLIHFGYSPIQFELYNNLNELKVFLKYLLGHVNTL